MPISPQARHRYPLDWAFLSWNIVVRRAGGRCECHGECGRTEGHLDPADARCRNRQGAARWRGKPGQRFVILSAAHLDGDPACRDLNRIIAACEGCHLSLDRGQHWATRRRHEEEQLGLVPLFELV